MSSSGTSEEKTTEEKEGRETETEESNKGSRSKFRKEEVCYLEREMDWWITRVEATGFIVAVLASKH